MLRKIGDKKAQNLTLGIIILIVLGITVLVFLIWGFSVGWGNFWDRIIAYTGGDSNVDSIKSGCLLACSGQQKSQYCESVQTLKKGDGTQLKGSCKTLESQLGLSGCDIDCGTDLPKKCEKIIVEGSGTNAEKGAWLLDTNKDKKCKDGTDETSSVGDSDGKNIREDKCCKLVDK
tara:strand:- start:37 stop:561 length:525 start_codon:yes stop_codon:yes gene_type:complete